MRTAWSIDHWAISVVRVRLAEDKVAGVAIYFVGVILEAQMRDAEERGDVGVILQYVSKYQLAFARKKENRLTIKLKEPKPSIS